MIRRGVYPGSFDPITLGHLDIITRASRLVDELHVAVASNLSKVPWFTGEERVRMIREEVKNYPNVFVDYFHGLLVNYVKAKKANVIFKGLRAISDFETEFQMALVNRELGPDIETVFLMTSHQYSYLSSSLVKEIAELSGNTQGMVSSFVKNQLKEKLRKMGMPPMKVPLQKRQP